MKVYCSHFTKEYFKKSNVYVCHLCNTQWYAVDSTPLVIVGYSNDDEVMQANRRQINPEKFVWCGVCKDLIKDEHVWCKVQVWLEKVKNVFKIKKTS